MNYLSALDFWGSESPENPYNDLLQALLENAGIGEQSGGTSGATTSPLAEGGGGYSRGSQFAPPNLPGGGTAEPLQAGWLNNPYSATGPQADTHFRKVTAANAAQNPLVRALIGALSPVPGSSAIANRYADYWLGQNVGGGSTARALGLGYADENPEIDPQTFYLDPEQQGTLGDTASRSGGGNYSANRMMIGSGSRMNPSSGFIWAMPGQSWNTRTEPIKQNVIINKGK